MHSDLVLCINWYFIKIILKMMDVFIKLYKMNMIIEVAQARAHNAATGQCCREAESLINIWYFPHTNGKREENLVDLFTEIAWCLLV